MSDAKKPLFCLIALFLLCLPLNAFTTENGFTTEYEGCPDANIPADQENYFIRWAILPDTIAPGSKEAVAVSGKSPPFSWSVSGAGFSLGDPKEPDPHSRIKILEAEPEACGPATIKVTDKYENFIEAEVRCTNGTWGDPTGGCILPGKGSTRGSGYLIKGKYKQTQRTKNISGWYFSWGECSGKNGDSGCATNPDCDPAFGCEPCLKPDYIPCINAGYARTECPPSCRAWSTCNTELYYQEWICSPE